MLKSKRTEQVISTDRLTEELMTVMDKSHLEFKDRLRVVEIYRSMENALSRTQRELDAMQNMFDNLGKEQKKKEVNNDAGDD